MALYRGVIHGQAGAAGQEPARRSFADAIARLDGFPTDLPRARNNFAEFLLDRAQDGLHGLRMRSAAGVGRPLLTLLEDWREAASHHHAAAVDTPRAQAITAVNRARLYALLADVLVTLEERSDGPPARLRRAAERWAEESATEAAGSTAGRNDPQVRAAAAEIRAHLAYRARRFAACRSAALEARNESLAAGSTAGAENAERMIGLSHLRESETAPDRPSAEAARREAVRHLRISQLLGESARTRFLSDSAGRARAGFFARKAYVCTVLAEVLLEDGRIKEALREVESAKARSLQDALAPKGTAVAMPAFPDLAAWPKGTAALEYFLGTRSAWVFVIDIGGRVGAHRLADPAGGPVRPADLVAEVRKFLHGIDGLTRRMRSRLMSGRGFDHAWQGELHRFRRLLVPEPALAELRMAAEVVIVPHHILHYFPFAALVTEPDPAKRGEMEMPDPRFLIDEPFSLCQAASLSAWSTMRQRPRRPMKRAAALGMTEFAGAPPLPGVARDMDGLRAAFGDRVAAVRLGTDATSEAALAELRRPGLLLIATHGRNLPDDPPASHLMLHPGDRGGDGRLTAADIFAARCDADLVVFGACYSGLADRSPLPGDDLFGLQRAVLHSGGRTVVSGLWDVNDDAGSELLGGLFRHLATGVPVSRALAASQRDFLRRQRAENRPDSPNPWLHPYFWAVYTVFGDSRTAFAN